MRSAVPERQRRGGSAALALAALVSASLFAGCGSNDNPGGMCDPAEDPHECDSPGSACPGTADHANFCEIDGGGCWLTCTNVCENPVDFPRFSVSPGGTCENDDDCAGDATCDNDTVGGTSSCTCIAPPTCENVLDVAFWSPLLLGSCTAANFVHDFGGTVGEWFVDRTCRAKDGNCVQADDEIFIGRDASDTTDLCWVADDEQYYQGRMCGSDFSFSRTASNQNLETGVFHFSTEDAFEGNWIIYDEEGGEIIARCRGFGSTTGNPIEAPSCEDYDPFGNAPPPNGQRYDGVFIERFNCVSDGECVDQDESGTIVITKGAAPDAYMLSGDNGYYQGTATLVGMELVWSASFHDPAFPEGDYTETGTYTFSDSDNFSVASSYRITPTGKRGTCIGYARRNATPPAPDPYPPCP